MPAQPLSRDSLPAPASTERRRMIMWIVLSALAALLGYFGFRGYFNPELLFHFANALHC